MEIENNSTSGNGPDESLSPLAEKGTEVDSTDIVNKEELKKEVETANKDTNEKEEVKVSKTGSEIKNDDLEEKKSSPLEVMKPEESNDEKLEKKDDKVEKKEESKKKDKSVEKKVENKKHEKEKKELTKKDEKGNKKEEIKKHEKVEKKEQRKDKDVKVEKKESTKLDKKDETKEKIVKKEELKEIGEKKEETKEKVEKEKELKEKVDKIEKKKETKDEEGKVERKEQTKEKDKKIKRKEKVKHEKVEKKEIAKNHLIDEEKIFSLEKNIKDSSTSHEEETVLKEKDLTNTDDLPKENSKEIENNNKESSKCEPMDEDVTQDENSNEKEPIIEEPDLKMLEKINESSIDEDFETKIEEANEEESNDQQVPVVDKYLVEEPPSPDEIDKDDNLNNNSEELMQIEKTINTITDDFEGFSKSDDTPKALTILKNLISQVEAEIAQNIFGEESEAELDNLEEIKNLDSSLLSTTAHDSSISDSSKKLTKVKPSYHLQKNPQFKLPFDLGWKREVIFRRTVTDYRIKKSCEVLYITPDGERLVSSLEVLDYLRTKNISTFTSNNFSFLKAPLGILDPEKEIIRRVKETMLKKKAISKTGKIVTKVTSSPKGTNSNEDNTPNKAKGFPKIKVAPPKLAKVSTPKAIPPKTATPKSTKTKTTAAKKQKKSDTPSVSAEPEQEQITPNWNSTEKTSPQRTKPDKKRLDPCSLRCPAGGGAIPTLQCSQCLWLFHYECVGLTLPTASSPSKGNYICKNCQQDKKGDATVTPPPSLTTIGTSPSESKNTSPSSTPKLQRLPKSGETSLITSTNIIASSSSVVTTTSKANKLLGAVTTWLPPASTIQLDSSKSSPPIGKTPSSSEAAQGLAKVGDRRYIVIPKHNVLSVTPTTSATAPASKPEPTQGPHAAAAAENPPGLLLVPLVAQMPPNSKDSAEQPPTAKRKLIEENTPPPSKRPRVEERFTEHFMSNMCLGYSGLLHIFEYLKVQDLLCAGRVCRLWRDLANHHSLWRTVRMKNSKVTDWSGLAECLRRHRTRHLDLRKMLLPAPVSNDTESMWTDFQNAIGKADALTRLDLCRCPAVVIQSLGTSSPGLNTLNALAIKCSSINLQPLNQLVNLEELRLKSVAGFELKGSLECFKELTSLKVLSLTTITNLGTSGLEHLAHLTNLESLDLGECCHFPQDFGPSILAKLVNLERLRLEKGQGADCPTFQILAGVKLLTKLTTLELINFDIKPGFDQALAACTNIRRILVIPTYITQSATTNHMLLSGVMKLSNTLHTFVWGVTNELLKVTELFVDQCDGGRQKGKKSDKKLGDSIPVLKPVPGSHLVNQDEEDLLASAAPPPVPAASGAEGAAAAANAQVEILPLSKLQKILIACFPNTRVKILKVPYNSTWRQTIAETNI